ncbi:hypothetical protein QFZ96_004719 [Paraburkholderia youngii]
MQRQAALELTLQVADLTLRDAQLILRGGLLLRQFRRLGALLLLLARDDALLLTRDVEVGLQPARAFLRQRDQARCVNAFCASSCVRRISTSDSCMVCRAKSL